MTTVMTVPARPICQIAGGGAPCPFAHRCHESRQLVQSGYAVSLGQPVQQGEPMWGEHCWAFQQFTAREGSEAQQERAAIQAEAATPASGTSSEAPA